MVEPVRFARVAEVSTREVHRADATQDALADQPAQLLAILTNLAADLRLRGTRRISPGVAPR